MPWGSGPKLFTKIRLTASSAPVMLLVDTPVMRSVTNGNGLAAPGTGAMAASTKRFVEALRTITIVNDWFVAGFVAVAEAASGADVLQTKGMMSRFNRFVPAPHWKTKGLPPVPSALTTMDSLPTGYRAVLVTLVTALVTPAETTRLVVNANRAPYRKPATE